jgi:hypothetical protein
MAKKSIFEFGELFGLENPLQEPQTPTEKDLPKIRMKCSTGTVKIKTDTVADINFQLDGSSSRGFGFDYTIKLSSDDRNLKIYDDSFELDKGWSFIGQISNSKAGKSTLICSSKNETAAKFNFEFVNDKSTFTRTDKDTIVNKNKELIGEDKVCFRVADKELSALLKDKSLVLNSYANLSGFTRIEDYKNKGYVYENKKFSQSEIWKRHTDGDYKLKPYEFASGQQNCFSTFVKSTMKLSWNTRISLYTIKWLPCSCFTC